MMRSVILLGLVILGVCASGTAHLIAQKRFERLLFALGKPVEISIRVFNVGDGDALDVQITDNWPKDSFTFPNGPNEAFVEAIPAGSSFEHNFTLVPQQLGSMSGFPAVVSYKATPDSEPILLRSSHNVEPVRILEERAFQRYVGSRTIEAYVFWLAVLAAVILPFAGQWYFSRHYIGGYHVDLFKKQKTQ